MKKRVLSLFMVLVLCLTLLPTAVFADVTENGEGKRRDTLRRGERRDAV